MTSEVVSEVLATAEAVAPESVAVQAVEAAVATVADPSAITVMNDVELAVQLIAEFKAKIAGLHPSVSTIIKGLFA